MSAKVGSKKKSEAVAKKKSKAVAKKKSKKKSKTAAKKQSKKKRKKAAKKKSKKSSGRLSPAQRIVGQLRDYSLGMPGAVEEFPWDHMVAKVSKKVFIFLDRVDVVGKLVKFSVKLPHTSDLALTLPFATPTGYGLGRSGWVSFSFEARDAPPLAMMREWIDESYRAIAPKRKIAELDARRVEG